MIFPSDRLENWTVFYWSQHTNEAWNKGDAKLPRQALCQTWGASDRREKNKTIRALTRWQDILETYYLSSHSHVSFSLVRWTPEGALLNSEKAELGSEEHLIPPQKIKTKRNHRGFNPGEHFSFVNFDFAITPKQICVQSWHWNEKNLFFVLFFMKTKELQHLLLEQFFISLQTIYNPGNEQFSTNFPSINSLDEKIQPEEKGSTNFLPKLLWTPRG